MDTCGTCGCDARMLCQRCTDGTCGRCAGREPAGSAHAYAKIVTNPTAALANARRSSWVLHGARSFIRRVTAARH